MYLQESGHIAKDYPNLANELERVDDCLVFAGDRLLRLQDLSSQAKVAQEDLTVILEAYIASGVLHKVQILVCKQCDEPYEREEDQEEGCDLCDPPYAWEEGVAYQLGQDAQDRANAIAANQAKEEAQVTTQGTTYIERQTVNNWSINNPQGSIIGNINIGELNQVFESANIDTEQLAKDLEVLAAHAKDSQQAEAAKHLENAQNELTKGEKGKALAFLKAAGKWTFDKATELGLEAAKTAIRLAMGG